MVEYNPTPVDFNTPDDLITALATETTLVYVNVPTYWVNGTTIKLVEISKSHKGKSILESGYLEIGGKHYTIVSALKGVNQYVIDASVTKTY